MVMKNNSVILLPDNYWCWTMDHICTLQKQWNIILFCTLPLFQYKRIAFPIVSKCNLCINHLCKSLFANSPSNVQNTFRWPEAIKYFKLKKAVQKIGWLSPKRRTTQVCGIDKINRNSSQPVYFKHILITWNGASANFIKNALPLRLAYNNCVTNFWMELLLTFLQLFKHLSSVTNMHTNLLHSLVVYGIEIGQSCITNWFLELHFSTLSIRRISKEQICIGQQLKSASTVMKQWTALQKY